MTDEEQRMIFQKNFRYYVDSCGKDQNIIAKELGYKYTTLNTWYRGTSMPNASKIQTLADYFHIGKSDLLDDHTTKLQTELTINESKKVARTNALLASAFWNATPERRNIVAEILGIEFHETGEKVRTLPFYGNIAAAGTSVNSYDILMHGTIECPDNRYTVKADYAIGVCGDSMEPEFHDGDIVLVMKRHTIDYGAIGIFQVDNDIYIKKLTRDGLRSLNENYPTIKNSRDIICLGEVIGRIEDLK